MAPEIHAAREKERLVQDQSGEGACAHRKRTDEPAGLDEVERAKQDGRWEAAYDSSGTAKVPADFELELEKSPRARAFFKTLSAANRYAIIWRLQTAKKAETREKRIQTFIEMLEKGETIH